MTVSVSRAFDNESRARTHLANERTFLAWLRTGLSLVAVGLAAASLLPLDLVPHFPYVRLFSVLLIVSGIATILLGARRYEVSGRQIDAGEMITANAPITAIAVIVAVLGAMALPLVVLLR